MTDRPHGTFVATSSQDGRFVFYLDDAAGNELGHVVRVPFEGGRTIDLTPDLAPYALVGIALNATGDRLAITIANADGSRVLVFEDASSEAVASPQVLDDRQSAVIVEAISAGGSLVICSATDPTRGMHLQALDWDSGAVRAFLSDGAEAELNAVMWSPLLHDSRLLATSTRSGFRRPLIWDPVTGKREDLALDDLPGEVLPLDWASDGDEILLVQTVRAIQEIHVHDPTSRTTRLLQTPRGTLGSWGGGIAFGRPGELVAIWQDSTNPPQLVALDARTGGLREVLISSSPVPESQSWSSVSFPSVDGEMIQAWLVTPAAEPPFPTIVHAHGGPDGCVTETFSAESQAWVDHGYAFLTINYRGSTTFGRNFEHKIYGSPGYWEVEDLAAGRRWLIAEGIAEPDAVLVAGTSYGGYLALQALGTRPELWAGGIAVAPIADWICQAEDASAPIQDWTRALLGGDPATRRDQYVSSSPIGHAEAVRAPVLIIAGRSDTTVPASGVERYEARMRSMGRPIEVRWFDGGHVSLVTRPDLLIEHQGWALEFATRVLAGDNHGLPRT
ncbi:MAG: S9 family peptidase [Chloroflexi bacterium]|nr:S9 family peptidase [Chloroflexota bacterium]